MSQARGVHIEHVSRIASGFGGGIAGYGATCGALVGAIISVGLERGRPDPQADAGPARKASGYIYRRFEEEMNSTVCRQLTGIDLRTPEGYQQMRESGTRERVCLRAGALAARLAQEALAYSDARG